MQSRGVARGRAHWPVAKPASAGAARRTWVAEERPVGAPQGARSTTKQRVWFGASLSQAGLAPESGVGIGVRFSESGIDSLVRSGGRSGGTPSIKNQILLIA